MATRKKTAKKRKEIDMIKDNTIKTYTSRVLDFKISSTARNNIRIRFNALTKDSLKEAKQIAQADNRKTIMPRDITPAMEKIVGRKHLSPADLMDELKSFSAADLVDLQKQIENHIENEKKKGAK